MRTPNESPASTPNSTGLPQLAHTLTRRAEVAYTSIQSGGTEIVGIIRAPAGERAEGDLLQQLPRTMSVLGHQRRNVAPALKQCGRAVEVAALDVGDADRELSQALAQRSLVVGAARPRGLEDLYAR